MSSPLRPLRKLAFASALASLAACGQGAEVEEGEWLPGGETTNTFMLGRHAFSRHVANISEESERLFFTGNSFFNQPWVEAPSSTDTRDGLGPLFVARACDACHQRDGRGHPPLESSDPFVSLLLRLSVPGEGPHGGPLPEPTYGGQLQPAALPGVPIEGTPRVTYVEERGAYADGTPYELRRPTYVVDELGYGDFHPDVMFSPRVAPQVIGLGLLEAIPEERLLALSDPDDDDGDGVSGRPNYVWDVASESSRIGRFGWKAEQPTLRQQSAEAFVGDMGITTPMFRTEECTDTQEECAQEMIEGEPEIDERLFERVIVYTSLLAVPVRRGWDEPEVLLGKSLFAEAQCTACHVPSHRTGPHHFAELSDQKIWPYTDLLLHDMGEDLADGRPTYGASGYEWRTPPLWGVGLFDDVNGHTYLMHDGRARGVAEAILWHGGEAEASREAFRSMNTAERSALVRFVESL